MKLTPVFHICLPSEWINTAASGGAGGTRGHRRHLGEARSFGLRCHTGTFLQAEDAVFNITLEMLQAEHSSNRNTGHWDNLFQ